MHQAQSVPSGTCTNAWYLGMSLYVRGLMICQHNYLSIQNNKHLSILSYCFTLCILLCIGSRNTVIGEIKLGLVDTFIATGQNLTALMEFYINSGGIYLLPEPVRFNTKILAVRAFGFLDDTLDVTTDLGPFLPKFLEPREIQSFLFVLVYRPIRNGSVYSLVQNLTQLNHGFTPGRLPVNQSKTLDWDVQEGDRIGVYIPRQCFNRSDGFVVCPSQINLETSECCSALYHPGLEGVDNLSKDEFKEVQVWLNLEAILSAPVSEEESNEGGWGVGGGI